jgi:two-component system, LytTR family, sensor kinase
MASTQLMSGIQSLRGSAEAYGPRRRWLGTRAYWVFQSMGWGAILGFGLLPILFAPHTTARTAWVEGSYDAVHSVSGLVLSHLLRVIILWNLQRVTTWTSFVVRMIPAWISVALVWSGISLWMILNLYIRNSDLPFTRPLDRTLFQIVDLMTLALPLMIIWTAFYLGICTYRQGQRDRLERVQLQAALHESELRTLKAQLDPHFLFNSLNSLRALISEADGPARQAVTRLADLLRATLQASRLSQVPLSAEWSIAENYLHLEQLRRGARLRWHCRLEPEALGCWVPPLILQGLVENALKHGIDTLEAGGEIRIDAGRSGEALALRVSNPGTLNQANAGSGLGLANSRARLRLVFGEHASLELREPIPGTVVAEVLIPQRNGTYQKTSI